MVHIRDTTLEIFSHTLAKKDEMAQQARLKANLITDKGEIKDKILNMNDERFYHHFYKNKGLTFL